MVAICAYARALGSEAGPAAISGQTGSAAMFKRDVDPCHLLEKLAAAGGSGSNELQRCFFLPTAPLFLSCHIQILLL